MYVNFVIVGQKETLGYCTVFAGVAGTRWHAKPPLVHAAVMTRERQAKSFLLEQLPGC